MNNNVAMTALSGSIGDMGMFDIAVNANGMEQYKEQLRISILVDVANAINEVSNVQNAISNIWVGASCDTFLGDFRKAREGIIADLEAEFHDIENRLTELQAYYFQQDRAMMSDGYGPKYGIPAYDSKGRPAVSTDFYNPLEYKGVEPGLSSTAWGQATVVPGGNMPTNEPSADVEIDIPMERAYENTTEQYLG